jgi:hypothetical protein
LSFTFLSFGWLQHIKMQGACANPFSGSSTKSMEQGGVFHVNPPICSSGESPTNYMLNYKEKSDRKKSTYIQHKVHAKSFFIQLRTDAFSGLQLLEAHLQGNHQLILEPINYLLGLF